MPWYPFPFPQVHLSCCVLLCPSTTNFQVHAVANDADIILSLLFFFLLVKLCFCPVFTCPSMSYYRLLSHCDFQVHFLIAQISQVITGCLVFTVSSRDQRILCQALVTFKYTSLWRRYQILALYYCCLRVGLLPCTMQQKNLLTSKSPDINSMQCNNNGTGETINKSPSTSSSWCWWSSSCDDHVAMMMIMWCVERR